MANRRRWKIILYYLLLCCSAAFINVPIVAVLALPCMVIALILLTVSILSLKAEYYSTFSTFLIVGGLLIIGFTSAQFSIEYTGYLVSISRHVNQRIYPSPLATFFPIILLGFIASVLFILGLKGRFSPSNNTLYKIYFVIFLNPLFVLVLITILYFIDYPLST